MTNWRRLELQRWRTSPSSRFDPFDLAYIPIDLYWKWNTLFKCIKKILYFLDAHSIGLRNNGAEVGERGYCASFLVALGCVPVDQVHTEPDDGVSPLIQE